MNMEVITKIWDQPATAQQSEQPEELYEDYLTDYNTMNIVTNMPQDASLRFILVPLAVLLGIITLSALVYLMARQRRSSVHYANTNQKTNNYRRLTACEEECAEIDDDPTECLLNGKLQINHRYENYQAAQVITIGKAKGELYT